MQFEGDPAHSLRGDPVPAEILAEALRTFDEAEVLAVMAEIRSGRGRKLEDFMPELESAVRCLGDTTPP